MKLSKQNIEQVIAEYRAAIEQTKHTVYLSKMHPLHTE